MARRSRTHRTSWAIAAIALVVALAFCAGNGSASASASDVAKARGEGTDFYGLDFYFRAKDPADPSGDAMFETTSFGDFDGEVDCLNVKRRRAALSGPLENPNEGAGLTHFMIVMKDHHREAGDPPDVITTWLRNGPFDCETEGFGSFDDDVKPISEGRLRVVPAG
jgi:hypothetical protein